jgi:ammonia channel protein AmtB
LNVDVNLQYAGVEFHYTYLMFCGFIVWLIIPGIGFLYGGLARRKSALALLFQSILVVAVSTFQWMFWVRSETCSVLEPVTNITLGILPCLLPYRRALYW